MRSAVIFFLLFLGLTGASLDDVLGRLDHDVVDGIIHRSFRTVGRYVSGISRSIDLKLTAGRRMLEAKPKVKRFKKEQWGKAGDPSSRQATEGERTPTTVRILKLLQTHCIIFLSYHLSV